MISSPPADLYHQTGTIAHRDQILLRLDPLEWDAAITFSGAVSNPSVVPRLGHDSE
jgi:hypothetical protein